MEKIKNLYDGKIKNDVSDAEKRLIELINGSKPKNPQEEKMVEEIKQAEKKGQIIYIPGM